MSKKITFNPGEVVQDKITKEKFVIMQSYPVKYGESCWVSTSALSGQVFRSTLQFEKIDK